MYHEKMDMWYKIIEEITVQNIEDIKENGANSEVNKILIY